MNADTRHSPTEAERTGDTDVPLFAEAQDTLLSMQAVMGRKWLPVIVYRLLADGPLGFSALKDGVDDVSSKMLAESLDELESAGLVTRELISDRPVRVEYALTEAGRALEPMVTEMVRWGTEYDVAAGGDDEAGAPEPERDGKPGDSRPARAVRLEGN